MKGKIIIEYKCSLCNTYVLPTYEKCKGCNNELEPIKPTEENKKELISTTEESKVDVKKLFKESYGHLYEDWDESEKYIEYFDYHDMINFANRCIQKEVVPIIRRSK